MDQFGLAGLIDKRLAVIGDARLSGETHKLVERLLSISGQDGISIPRKYKDDWNGTLDTRFLILSNKLPSFTDASGVIADRFILIRFLESSTAAHTPSAAARARAAAPAGASPGSRAIAFSLGKTPKLDSEDSEQLGMYETVLAACRKRRIYPGIHCGEPAYAARMIRMGFRLTTIANDSGLMAKAARAAVAGVWKEVGEFR